MGSACPAFSSTVTVITVGQAAGQTGGDPTPAVLVSNGDNGVQVKCSVSPPQAGFFDVSLSVKKADATGGEASFTLLGEGLVDPMSDPGFYGTGQLHGSVSTTAFGEYGGSGCSINYNTPIASGQDGPPVGVGRIWGHMSCPGLFAPDMTTMTLESFWCDAEADFIFEDCSAE
jgi:hypothetical protein